MRFQFLLLTIVTSLTGCTAVPDMTSKPNVHNPFPQLHRVAVMPFNNLSNEPTVDGEAVANAYFAELQQVPGFEVIPVGVVAHRMEADNFPAVNATGEDYRRLAKSLGADAIVVGAVTDYQIYTPPRFSLAINWYAANPGFHPVPPGYGLPWGTAEEEFIPEALVFDSEFALAREQLKTQTPDPMQHNPLAADTVEILPREATEGAARTPAQGETEGIDGGIPGWPDPRGFIPPAPVHPRPRYIPQSQPIMTLTKMYNGNDVDFTERLAKYYYHRDDSLFRGWQTYLTNSDEFIRFCCHLHISEMLVARGGAGKSRVVWRWPIGRYER